MGKKSAVSGRHETAPSITQTAVAVASLVEAPAPEPPVSKSAAVLQGLFFECSLIMLRGMPDDPLRPAEPDDVRQALAFALAFDGRRRFRQADDLMARITADHLVRYLEMAGFVVMRRPGRGDFAAVARGQQAPSS